MTYRFATTQTDKMVLQASPQRSIVWGFAENSSTSVRVCIVATPDKCVNATLEPGPDNSGAHIFSATLPEMPPSATAYDVSATATPSGKTITLRDVVWGDVYVCSGSGYPPCVCRFGRGDKSCKTTRATSHIHTYASHIHTYHITSRHVISHHTTSYHITSHHITPHHIAGIGAFVSTCIGAESSPYCTSFLAR